MCEESLADSDALMRAGTARRRWRSRLALLLAGMSVGALIVTDIARAADVDITTSTNNGFVLDAFAGTTAQVEAGVTVSNTTFNFSCAGTASALCATTKAWTVTNLGTIGPADSGSGVYFTAGGAVINSGSLSGSKAVTIEGGASGSVDNKLGATISSPGCCGGIVIGENSGIAGTVTNAGSITSASQSVSLWGGGTVTNLATGTIMSTGGANAISVILGTSRMVENSGLIQSNDSGFGTGVAMQNGTVINHATGQILGAYNGIWANGSSATSITNDGYIEAKLAQGSGSAIEVDGGGTVVNTGTIKSLTSNGNTSDAGINFSGAGSVTNSGTIESTTGGKAIIFNGALIHTLTLDTGSILGGNVQGGSGTDNLVLKGIGTETISKFLSFETLSMQGTEWNLLGTGTFTTSSTVSSGFLHVNGQLTSPTVTIDAAGKLGGTGTVVGNIVNNGTLAPGNSIGTLNVTGNYTQAAGSTYSVELNTIASDLINITGTATILPGTTVSVLAAIGAYTLGQQYTILTAAGGVAGTYTTLTDNAPFVDFILSYDPTNVYLSVIATGVPFAQVAQSPNQQAAAGAITSLGAGNPVFDAVMLLNTPDALRAFDLLSGEIHASIAGTLLGDSRFLRDAITGRLHQAGGGLASLFAQRIATSDAGADALAYAGDGRKQGSIDRALAKAPAPVTAWGQAFGAWGRNATDGNASTLTQKTGGFILGIDSTLGNDAWRFGIAGGYQRTFVDVGDRSSSGRIDGYHAVAYAGGQYGPVGVRLGAAYTWNEISTDRMIAFPGFADATSSSYGGGTAQAFGEIGYAFDYHHLALEPFAGLAVVGVHTNGFAEAGGAASLIGAASDTSATFSTAGLRVAAALPGTAGLVAKGTIGWRHAFGTVTPTAQLAFAAGGTPFTVAGVPIAEDAALIEAGLDGRLSDHETLSIAYDGQLGSKAQQHEIKLSYIDRF
jgi:outer membrane autotransporter protein